ncbi:MAG: DNA-formamidopyrimidine glycosylase family protein [Planctomycetota bacterium]
MPELPEVETMRRGVLPTIGHTIVSVERPPCDRKPILFEPTVQQWNRRLRGRQIHGVSRLGKRVILEIQRKRSSAVGREEDDPNGFDQAIVFEPRMTGLVLIADPPGNEHLRLRLKLEGPQLEGPRCDELLFWDRRGLGTARLLTREELQSRVQDRLGPDALAVGADDLRGSLFQSRRAVKVSLLDQAIVAGIGNLYAAEILFVAGVDPRTRCDKISRPQWRRIQSAIGSVLGDAIRHEGSTLSDGTYRNALNDAGGYQNYHRVYDREGETCVRCRTGIIRRIVQAQRSTFFCPRCQRRSGLHAAVREILVPPASDQAVQ